MSILLFLVFGLIVGLIARALLPGRQRLGLIATMLLGVAGSFVGGFIGALITDSKVTDLNTAGIIGSVIGAILLLVVAGGAFRSSV
jgi:uncharacterized membrane protein YeaQ/YmgE (transglycosylase-associated protein family)